MPKDPTAEVSNILSGSQNWPAKDSNVAQWMTLENVKEDMDLMYPYDGQINSILL